MKVLIGGASGFIGKHLSRLLMSKGHTVTGISRSPGPNKITWIELYENGLPENTDAVVNLAGQNLMSFTRWNQTFEEQLRASRIDTTKQLADIISKTHPPPKVFVSASAVGFYPPSETAKYTEDSEGGSGDFLATLSRDWEAAAKLSEASDCRNVIVRIGLALGRDGGTVQSMIVPFWFGLGGRIGSGKQWFPWIHVDDVAGIFAHAIESDQVTGVLNAVAPEESTNADFTAAFAAALWRPALFPVPGFVMHTALGDVRAKAILEGQRVAPKRTLEIGYKFIYPDLKSACKEFAHILPNMRSFSL